MCFYHDDYGWLARQQDEADITTIAEKTCDECGRAIPVGAFAHTIHQQEYEDGECRACENGDCNCPVDPETEDRVCSQYDCHCETPDVGRTFDYVRCQDCDKLLKAIEAAEVEEGCHVEEARPAFPMHDDLQGIGAGECKRYWKKAVAMFPELKASGYLAFMWNKLF